MKVPRGEIWVGRVLLLALMTFTILPFISILCPGSTDNSLPSSGAPKMSEGMKSMNVFMTAIDTTKAIIACIPRGSRKGINDKSIIYIVFGWRPGIRPVTIPMRMPKNMKIRISKNIDYSGRYDYLHILACVSDISGKIL